MARKNRNQIKSSSSNQRNEKEMAEKLEKDTNKLIDDNNISEDEMSAILQDVKVPNEATYKSAKDLYHKTLSIQKVFEKKKSEYDNKVKELEKQKTNIENQKTENEKLKTDLKIRLTKYDAELKEVNRLRVEGGFGSIIDKELLDSYEEKLKDQEKILLDKITELTNKHQEYISSLSDLEITKIELEKDFEEKISSEKEKLKNNFKSKFNVV